MPAKTIAAACPRLEQQSPVPTDLSYLAFSKDSYVEVLPAASRQVDNGSTSSGCCRVSGVTYKNKQVRSVMPQPLRLVVGYRIMLHS